MPSGAKKRKADKKKKGKANHHSTTNTQQVSEIDVLKTLEEKDSDGGEISSPKSQPENRSSTENEEQGEVERQGQDSHTSASVAVADSESMEVPQNGTGNGDAVASKQKEEPEVVEVVEVIEVTNELKLEEDEVVKDIHVTRVLKRDEGSESKVDTIESVERDFGGSSSSSSSDNESPVEHNNFQVMASQKIEEEEKGGSSAMETKPDVYSVDKLEEERVTTMDIAADVDLTGKLDEKNCSAGVKEIVGTVDLAEPVPLIEEMNEVFSSSSIVDTRVSCEIGLASQDKEEIALPSSNINVGALNVIDSVAKESEDKILQLPDAPIVETNATVSAELPKDDGIAESSVHEPLLGTVPPSVERTSWKSCCGIFDFLRGQNR